MAKILNEADLSGMDARALCAAAVGEVGGINVHLASGAMLVVSCFHDGAGQGSASARGGLAAKSDVGSPDRRNEG